MKQEKVGGFCIARHPAKWPRAMTARGIMSRLKDQRAGGA
jgi:hypothetical protein